MKRENETIMLGELNPEERLKLARGEAIAVDLTVQNVEILRGRLEQAEHCIREVAASLAWNCFGECRAVHDGPIMPAQGALEMAHDFLASQQGEQSEDQDIRECETCKGTGEIDNRLGGWRTDGISKCDDCDGHGEWIRNHKHPEQAEGAQGEREVFEHEKALAAYAAKTGKPLQPAGKCAVQDQYVFGWMDHSRADLAQPSPVINYALLHAYACENSIDYNVLCAAVRDSLAQPSPAQELRGMDLVHHVGELIEGKTVSLDVSTGDHDAGNRLFATVCEVMADGDGFTILAVDPKPNFEAPAPELDDEYVPEGIVEAVLQDSQVDAVGLAAAALAPELERPEVVGHIEIDDPTPEEYGDWEIVPVNKACEALAEGNSGALPLMTVAQHDRIVQAENARAYMRGMSESGEAILELEQERDAAQARVAELEKQEPSHEMYAAAQTIQIEGCDGEQITLNTSDIRKLWLAMNGAKPTELDRKDHPVATVTPYYGWAIHNMIDTCLPVGTKLYAAQVAQAGQVPEALRSAFMTSLSGNGRYEINLKFDQLADAQASHDYLLKLIAAAPAQGE